MVIKNLGELEEKKSDRYGCFEAYNAEKQYLFYNEEKEEWWISPKETIKLNSWEFDIKIHPKTFLTIYISADRPWNKCDKFKIKFKGDENWITVNKKFLNNKISYKELDKIIRNSSKKLVNL